MARRKNVDWDYNGTWDGAALHTLMDVRDELQTLVRFFSEMPCIARQLRSIERQLKLQRRCPVHPRYTARREPTTACRACWRYWRAVWK